MKAAINSDQIRENLSHFIPWAVATEAFGYPGGREAVMFTAGQVEVTADSLRTFIGCQSSFQPNVSSIQALSDHVSSPRILVKQP